MTAPTSLQLAIAAGPSSGSASPCWRGGWSRHSPTCATPWSGSPRTTPAATSERTGGGGAHAAARGVGAAGPATSGVGAHPDPELAILRKPVTRFYGEKVSFAMLGLVIPPVLTVLFTLLRREPAVPVPLAGSGAFATVLFMVPDYNARDDAKRARAEFSRALGAYIDLVALERNNGAGPRQAMEAAAAVGDSWVFRRLGEELARTRWSGPDPVGGAASPG
jgi:hypothetical protein